MLLARGSSEARTYHVALSSLAKLLKAVKRSDDPYFSIHFLGELDEGGRKDPILGAKPPS